MAANTPDDRLGSTPTPSTDLSQREFDPQTEPACPFASRAMVLTAEGDAERMMRAHAEYLLIAIDRTDPAAHRDRVYVLSPTGTWVGSQSEVELKISDEAANAAKRATSDLPAHDAKRAITHLKRNASRVGARDAASRIGVVYRRWRNTGDPDFARICHAFVDQLDSDAQFLGCENGVVNLGEGALMDRYTARRSLVTRTTGVPFIPDAKRWAVDALLDHFPPDLKEFMLSMLGTALWGKPGRWLLIIVGSPVCGKTTLSIALHSAVGRYAGTISSDLLRPTRGGRVGTTPERESLVSCRIVTGAEVENWRIDPAQLKACSGEGDRVPVQPKFKPERTAVPTATMVFIGNAIPVLSSSDPAVADRIRVVEYPTPPQPDPRIKDAFVNDSGAAVAFLALLVRYAKLNPSGADIPIPTEVTDAIGRAIAAEETAFDRWLDSNTVRDEAGRISSALIWAAWADYHGVSPNSAEIADVARRDVPPSFRRRVGAGPVGSVRVDGRVVQGWAGYRLLPPQSGGVHTVGATTPNSPSPPYGDGDQPPPEGSYDENGGVARASDSPRRRRTRSKARASDQGRSI